jgi:hypothetical protein
MLVSYMSENIFIQLDESFPDKNNNIHKLLTEFENIENKPISDEIFCDDLVALIKNYDLNYTVKKLFLISDYYGLSKQIKANKGNKLDIIYAIVIFENDDKNEEIVFNRQKYWTYMEELSSDPFMKKFVLW